MNQPQPTVEQVLAQQKPRRRGLTIVILLLIFAAVALLRLFAANDDAALQFVTSEVVRGDLTIQVTATGSLEPLNQVDVGSEMSGIIESVSVDFNDRVRQGQVLARLNSDEQQAKVVQTEAALEVAEAGVLQAAATVLETELRLTRCQTLAAKGLCPPQDQDAAQAAYARAKADEASAKALVSQARATLDVERTRLAKTEIRSPIDGIVLKRQIEPGQTVAASLQAPVLFTLAENLAQMELRVTVDEADIGKVNTGQVATFTVDAYRDQVFPARITQVRLAPISEGGVVSYETMLALSNEALLLRPGMTATAHITVEQIHDALLVPNAALRFVPPTPQTKQETGFMDQLMPGWGSRGQPAQQGNKVRQVWVLEANQPRVIDIETGSSDGRATQVHGDGLQAGMQVITDASYKK
ncbi:MAG TPA: efflux RND transporter periplasmic adaptor subunit [Candidatus Tenderia electrophaga]|uniref:Efflux RND transporter periplasmic adaptor subunit n=1 Tax=Candidatus Tenderia electrophaga TaxID=1748243 RepID=A0A832N4J3_9GAMM|nr:efflux RND transporter periplasmic adaptor subunit [Candidatus Tenderia electrophaga]